MKAIFKYELRTDGKVSMPHKAKILSVQNQREVMYLWAMVDTNNEPVDTQFYVFGTGHPLPDDIDELEYITTIQMTEGIFVWHVFKDAQ